MKNYLIGKGVKRIMTTKTVLGVFTERTAAEEAINSLKSEGYDPKDISIVMKNKEEGEKLAEDTGSDVMGGAVSGATTGAVLGGLAGLIASFIIPGLGAFWLGGPIAAALGLTGAAASTASGAATGAVAGGLLGALTGFGLSEEDAKSYEEQVNAGGILVAVPARTGEENQVESILSDTGADNIKTVQAKERQDRFEQRSTTTRNADTTHETYQSSHQPAYAAGMKGGQARSDDSGSQLQTDASQTGKSTTSRGNKGGRSSASKKGSGRGWHVDSEEHAAAARGEDVPNRGKGE